ncbi:hypothetical protein EHO57_14070 [Leptospira langatensis]|uniref:Uncharacterized protein n=1 Tax=Leptospira langatensis TaxID=2484983 RepID=A0A5R2ATA9_9LEPT|nr:AAA family ATPase [Leptospira langatensis]TGJ99881.1 hypothetical protein EHO57_14070 [Leptospira langatensis]
MMRALRKAKRLDGRLRLLLAAPPEALISLTALEIATGIEKDNEPRIAVIRSTTDTFTYYADKFSFDEDVLENPSTDHFISAIENCVSQGYSTLIIDSLTHSWQHLLSEVDRKTKTHYKGNSGPAWADFTPKQRELMRVLQTSPCHIIALVRNKFEHATIRNEATGKVSGERILLGLEQSKELEYEFDTVIQLDHLSGGMIIRDFEFPGTLLENVGNEFPELVAGRLLSKNQTTNQEPCQEEGEAPQKEEQNLENASTFSDDDLNQKTSMMKAKISEILAISMSEPTETKTAQLRSLVGTWKSYREAFDKEGRLDEYAQMLTQFKKELMALGMEESAAREMILAEDSKVQVA